MCNVEREREKYRDRQKDRVKKSIKILKCFLEERVKEINPRLKESIIVSVILLSM